MRLLTHNGLFHADEVFAVSLISLSFNKQVVMCKDFNDFSDDPNVLKVLRTREEDVVNKCKLDDSIFVVDVGEEYDVNMLNFDHHQDVMLFASNFYIFKYLKDIGKIEDKVYNELCPFMEGISDYDTNFDNANVKWYDYNSETKFRNTSSIIAGFNRDPANSDLQNEQFKLAVISSAFILINEIHLSKERVKAKEIFKTRTVLDNNVAVFDKYCSIWKKGKKHAYAVMPTSQGWSITSRDSNLYPIPKIDHEDLVFQHKAGFIAIVKRKKSAIEIASKL